jgi:hypothetical protein
MTKKMILANNLKIKDNRSTYPGGKGGSGVHQNIINLIPPHGVYIETHLGGGSILKYKRPAAVNIGIDLDPEVIKAWSTITKNTGTSGMIFPSGGTPINGDALMGRFSTSEKRVPVRAKSSGHIKSNDAGSSTASPEMPSGDGHQYFTFINEDASSFLKNYKFAGNEFVYVDPPYLMETRKGGKLYDFEYTNQDHVKLLSVLQATSAKIMISGYWSPLYQEMLQGWNTHNFEAQTRNGMATEWLWFNYPRPEKLHDYRYIGDNFKAREHIKNKRKRWVARLQKLPAIERNAMIEALNDCLPDPVSLKTKI